MSLGDRAGRRRTCATLALAAVLPIAFATAATGTASSEVADSIVGLAHQPPQLTVTAGTTVTWTNHSYTAHTVTAVGGQFGSGPLAVGEGFKVTFSTPGTFAYTCTIHPSMKGQVTVLAPGQTVALGGGSGSLRVSLGRASGAGGAVTIVRVHAPRPGASVSLQLHYANGTPWRTVRRGRLSSSGQATLKLAGVGRRRLRIVVAGSGGEPALIGKSLQAPSG